MQVQRKPDLKDEFLARGIYGKRSASRSHSIAYDGETELCSNGFLGGGEVTRVVCRNWIARGCRTAIPPLPVVIVPFPLRPLQFACRVDVMRDLET